MNTLGVFLPLIIHLLCIHGAGAAQKAFLGARFIKDFGAGEHTEIVTHKHGFGGKCGITIGSHIVYTDPSHFSSSLKILLI